MSKSIFVSCVHEDSDRIASLEKWASDGKLGDFAITKETQDNRPLGKSAIKEHISAKIKGAAVLLVLVGRDTHNHDWIEAEVELANSFHKKIICVRIPGTSGGKPPILNNYAEVNFDPASLKKELEKP